MSADVASLDLGENGAITTAGLEALVAGGGEEGPFLFPRLRELSLDATSSLAWFEAAATAAVGRSRSATRCCSRRAS